MNRVILIKYGELTTKKGNRKFFINTLYKNINDKLKSFFSFFNRFIIWACTITSNAVVGSSNIINLGFKNNAAAITTLCFIPPESSCGYLSITLWWSPTYPKYS